MCLAVPMKVIEIKDGGQAIVETGDISMEISIQLLSDVSVGDYVIVHTGFALEKMDPKAAEETLSVLRELAAMDATDMGMDTIED